MPLSPKQVTPPETDAERADKVNNCAARLLERLRSCVEQANRIAARGDKAAIVAALDPEVVLVLDSAAALVTTHTGEEVINDVWAEAVAPDDPVVIISDPEAADGGTE